MYNSHGGRGSNRKGRGSKRSSTTTTKVPLKGLFSDGGWKCNCDPRLPAQRFQTKNGGKNHGRWFYTCQHTQPKRCDFFLWEDEAKGREAAAVLNNSRTEPGLFAGAAPTTPRSKPLVNTGLVTPQTEGRGEIWGAEEVRTPYTKTPVNINRDTTTKAREKHETKTIVTPGTDGSDDEFFDWPASDAEELGKAADKALGNHSSIALNEKLPPRLPPPPETPRKAVKTNALTTPGKRRYDELEAPTTSAGYQGYPTPSKTGGLNGYGEDIFTTPSTNLINTTTGGKTPLFTTKGTNLNTSILDDSTEPPTPTPIRYYKGVPPTTSASSPTPLTSEILTLLTTTNPTTPPLPASTLSAITQICTRHVLYTRGIMQGRDVSRAMVKTKNEKMVEMQGEIEALRGEREMMRGVIRHLRRERGEGR